mgnify:CR=1 FL=1
MSKYWPKQSRADRIKEKTRLAIAHLGDERDGEPRCNRVHCAWAYGDTE